MLLSPPPSSTVSAQVVLPLLLSTAVQWNRLDGNYCYQLFLSHIVERVHRPLVGGVGGGADTGIKIFLKFSRVKKKTQRQCKFGQYPSDRRKIEILREIPSTMTAAYLYIYIYT